MSTEEQENIPQENSSPNKEDNNNENNDNNNDTERQTESMPIGSETLLSRESYLEDDFNDEKSDKTMWERCCGPIRAGSLRGAVLSLASIVFGICGFTFPIGFSNLGLIPSFVLLVVLCSICYWSLSALLFAARKKKILKYGPLIKECLGSKMALFSDINNIIFCIGILMSYEFTISTFFMDIYGKFFTVTEDNEKLIKLIQMGGCMLLFQLPLSLLRNISKLQYASMVGCAALIYTTLVIFIESPFYYKQAMEENPDTKIPWFKPISMKFFDSFSIFLYGFASHNGILPIFDELVKPTKRRSYEVLRRGYLLEVFVFLFLGMGGFFSLRDPVPSIFISREDLKFSWMRMDYFMLASKILFLITLHCSTAINNNIIRNSFKSLFLPKGQQNFPFPIDFAGVFFLLLITNGVTFFINDVLKIINIIGGICAVIVSFLSPVMCWMKTNGLPYSHYKNVLAIILLVVIVIIGCVSAGYSVYKDINGED